MRAVVDTISRQVSLALAGAHSCDSASGTLGLDDAAARPVQQRNGTQGSSLATAAEPTKSRRKILRARA